MKGHAKHYLRELTALKRYPVFGSEGREGALSGFVFDPSDWRILQFIVDTDPEADSLCLVSVRDIRAIDEEAHRIKIEPSGGSPLFMSRDEIEYVVSQADLACSHNLVGQEIQGLDAPAGRVTDLLVNIDVWELRYLVIATGTKSVLTDIEWCVSIGGQHASPSIDLPAAAVATAPGYRSLDELCIGYEEALYRHYTQRGYVSNDSVA